MNGPDQDYRIGLGLGANLGDAAQNLRRAIAELTARGLRFEALSSLYQSKAWGVTDQPDFLNACALARTRLAPPVLLELVKTVERELGRTPSRRWGPREIDIDILFYDGLDWRDDRLTLPHPSLFDRAFVLAPLAEIAPDLCLGGVGVADAARKIDTTGLRRLGPL